MFSCLLAQNLVICIKLYEKLYLFQKVTFSSSGQKTASLSTTEYIIIIIFKNVSRSDLCLSYKFFIPTDNRKAECS